MEMVAVAGGTVAEGVAGPAQAVTKHAMSIGIRQ
jgi:hypothetical protein